MGRPGRLTTAIPPAGRGFPLLSLPHSAQGNYYWQSVFILWHTVAYICYSMRTVNKVILIGNIGQLPSVTTLADGKKVARISLATADQHRDATGTLKTYTEWHTVVAWGSLAEIVEKYCNKGTSIYVEGKLKTRSYTANDGTTNYTTEVVVQELVVLDKKPSNPQE